MIQHENLSIKKPSPRKKLIAIESEGSKFLSRLTSNPALPAYIKKMQFSRLSNLIHRIGLEDSAELVALASSAQIKEILNVELWTSCSAGKEEKFNIENFIRWLALWEEIGDKFTADALHELDVSLVVLCFMKLIIVFDSTEVELSGSGFHCNNFVIYARLEEYWFEVECALSALWGEHPDYLLDILRRCCFESSILMNDSKGDDTAKVLEVDLKYNRNSAHDEKGFVTPVSANVFLQSCRSTSLDSLLTMDCCDLNTERYLDDRQNPPAQVSVANMNSDDESELQLVSAKGIVGKSVELVDSIKLEELTIELENVLKEAQVVLDPMQRRLLNASESQDRKDPGNPLKQLLLEQLEENQDAFSQRSREIAYLSNIVMAGLDLRGRRFTEQDASDAVFALSNLGFEFILANQDNNEMEEVRYRVELRKEFAIIKSFQLGFHLVSMLPSRALVSIASFISQLKNKKSSAINPWIRNEILNEFKLERFGEQIREGNFVEVKEMIDFLSIVLDNAVCQCLTILVDSFPCFPNMLNSPSVNREHIDTTDRFIASISDLDIIERFLEIEFKHPIS